MLNGHMQHWPLLVSTLIEFAAHNHGDTEIVSRRVEGDLHRSTWAQVARRARQLANRLDADGVPVSARVATLAWNGYRHLELYYGVSGAGRVLHTLNPRLLPDQLAWIVNHAEDEVLCFRIDADGFMQITDRSKDLIKSGGEWISSIELENIAMAHPGVAMAACIGMPHPKWDERPVLVAARKPGATAISAAAGPAQSPSGSTGRAAAAPMRTAWRAL